MTEPIYERYKEALRDGHVAALRGRLEAALEAYGRAAEIAPERALPHTSRGGMLHRLGRHEEALRAYAAALERSPREEAALAGRADVLLALGRPAEAAEALDRLAEAQNLAGQQLDAQDTARRALELAESRTRRELVEHLAREPGPGPADETAPAADEIVPAVDETAPAVLGAAPQVLEPETANQPAIDRGQALTAEAEVLVMAGDGSAARERCLAAASAHRAAGRGDAAMDACHLGLSIAPGDLALHLVLAELYVERGWRSRATEKLLLLGRLVDLDGDPTARQRLCAVVSTRFTDEPRLMALCG